MKIKRGFLYLADLSPRFGSEAGKTRPVLVVQADDLNMAGHTSTWVLPCTTKLVGENILRVSLPQGIASNHKACEIMIDQSRAIDNQRIVDELGQVPALLMKEVERKLRLCAGLK